VHHLEIERKEKHKEGMERVGRKERKNEKNKKLVVEVLQAKDVLRLVLVLLTFCCFYLQGQKR
jgi:hypothetical protein